MIVRNLDVVITCLATDGTTIDGNVLLEIAQMDNPFFMFVNAPLVEADLATAMIDHQERDCNM